MIRSVAVQRIQDGLGFRTDMADKIALRLQEAQRDLERGKTLPSFMKITLEDTLLQNHSFIALPVDFLRRSVDEIAYLPPGADQWVYLPWRNERFVNFAVDVSGAPAVAALSLTSGSVYFDRIADVDYTVYFTYYRKGVVLDADVENLWLEHAPELLIGDAGRRIAADMRNKTAFELFDAMWKQSRASWFNEAVLEDQDEQGDMFIGANN